MPKVAKLFRSDIPQGLPTATVDATPISPDYGTGADGAVTAGAGTTDFGTVNFKQYTSLTIAAGRTVKANSPFIVLVSGTFTCDGTLTVNAGNAGAGGTLIVIAKEIVGSGTINANATGGSSTPIGARLLTTVFAAATAGVASGSGGTGGTGGFSARQDLSAYVTQQQNDLIKFDNILTINALSGSGAGAGGEGTSTGGGGGGGGANFGPGGNGGNGGSWGGSGTSGAGGNGGSAGGNLMIATTFIASTMTLSTTGFAGVNGAAASVANGGGGGGGGGGSGGELELWADVFGGTVTVTGGAAGIGGAGLGTGVAGANGIAGNSGHFIRIPISV